MSPAMGAKHSRAPVDCGVFSPRGPFFPGAWGSGAQPDARNPFWAGRTGRLQDSMIEDLGRSQPCRFSTDRHPTTQHTTHEGEVLLGCCEDSPSRCTRGIRSTQDLMSFNDNSVISWRFGYTTLTPWDVCQTPTIRRGRIKAMDDRYQKVHHIPISSFERALSQQKLPPTLCHRSTRTHSRNTWLPTYLGRYIVGRSFDL